MKRFLLSAGVLFLTTAAFGHAFVDHAAPKVGETVSAAPAEVRITFTEELNLGTLQVFDATGKEVDKKDAHVDAKDKTQLVVSLPIIAEGTYKVVWSVTAVDTHKTHGDFEFTFKAKG